MDSSYFVYCYHCGKSKASSEEQLQSLIERYGDWVYCSCGEKIKLRLTKQDYRKFKLKKIKINING